MIFIIGKIKLFSDPSCPGNYHLSCLHVKIIVNSMWQWFHKNVWPQAAHVLIELLLSMSEKAPFSLFLYLSLSLSHACWKRFNKMNLFGSEWLHLQWHASNSGASHINTISYLQGPTQIPHTQIQRVDTSHIPCFSFLTNGQRAIKALQNTCQFPLTLITSLAPTWSVI